MPTLMFFSSVVNVLYYLKVIQYFLAKGGWVFHLTMGTSPIESVNSIATVALGPVFMIYRI